MPVGRIAGTVVELNFNVVWNMVPDNVKGAFIGAPRKVNLGAGFMLFKLTEFYIANRAGQITKWWSPVQPYESDLGLMARIHLAKHFGTSLADVTRVVAAVRENWNALTHVIQARLLKPVYGFWGQCSSQPRLEAGAQARVLIPAPPARGDMPAVRTSNLPGFAWQFYIPNLTSEHIEEVSRLPI
jgi:hypothetical protein